jgi:hypothetical protein
MPHTTPRPAMTDPDALLLFVTEPQQLDAVFEYGTETLTVDSIRVAAPAFTSCRSCDGSGEADPITGRYRCRRCAGYGYLVDGKADRPAEKA